MSPWSSLAVALVATLALTLPVTYGQVPQCSGTENANPFYTDAPVLVNSVANGKLYTVGGADNEIKIVHVYGSPYEMGLAQGQLVKPWLAPMLESFFNYIESQVDPYLKDLPVGLRKMIEELGIIGALDVELLLTAPYTPAYFTEEIKGIADGSGVSEGTIARLNIFPELIKAACSIIGGWGNASSTGGLVQVRALDWGTNNTLRQYPMITVYHPSEGNGHPFASLGWMGFVGSLTGFSTNVGICEKVWLKYNETSTRRGYPWHYLLRDILQYDDNVQAAIKRMQNARRTCSIFSGLGDHNNNFNIIEYAHEELNVFGDSTPFPGYAPTPAAHPLIKDVVYVDKHEQPSSDPCLGAALQHFYGQFNPQTMVDTVSLLQTGDLHISIYDYAANAMYVSVATQTVPYPPPPNAVVQPAYERQFIKLDANALFTQTMDD